MKEVQDLLAQAEEAWLAENAEVLARKLTWELPGIVDGGFRLHELRTIALDRGVGRRRFSPEQRFPMASWRRGDHSGLGATRHETSRFAAAHAFQDNWCRGATFSDAGTRHGSPYPGRAGRPLSTCMSHYFVC